MFKKRNLIFICLLILGVFLITSCLPKPPVTEGILKGQVIVPESSKQLTGQALANATVNIIDPATGAIIATTITDANGYYQVFVPAGGPYLLQAVKDGVKLLQITPQVEVGIEYDLGIADCNTTAVALIALAMMDAGANLADINLADIEADPNFDDVMSAVTSAIEAGGDPTALAVVQQAVEDFLYPLTPAPPTTPAPTPVQATPTFNPPAGAVAFGTTVTITSAGADAIYYTTDGSNPATSETGATLAYTAPLTIDAAKTVKAIAVKAGYTNSAIGSAVYTQAATADLTGLALTGSPGNYTFASGTYTYNSVTVANAVASITVTPTGAGTITVDGTTVTSGNASNLITLEAGVEKTITVVATETGKTAKTYTIKVTRAALTVGDSYAGGIVAYIFQNGDPGYVAGEQHGLIAAAADQSAGVAWSPNYSGTFVAIGETGIALYTGKDNTDKITEFYDNSIYSSFSYAAGIARDYESGGYNDWFLPSLSEMLKLCDNRIAIGSFVAGEYWSSSEYNRVYAYYTGNYSSPWWDDEGYKNWTKRVRAVRYF